MTPPLPQAADREALMKAMLDWHAAVTAFGADSATAGKHFDVVAAQAKAGAPHQGELHAKETSRQAPSTVGAMVSAGNRHDIACDTSGQALQRTFSAAPLAGRLEPDRSLRQDACQVVPAAGAPQPAGEAELVTGEGWISVKDRVPDEGVDVLVRVQMTGGQVRHAVAGRFRGYEDSPADWYSFEQPERELEVTHWMPLPSAPTASGSGSGND